MIKRDIVSFDDLYPGLYFEVDNNATQLGIAFMKKPSYLTVEPAITKIVKSDLLKIENSQTPYFISELMDSLA
ncbi:hypothetical protein LJR153_003521 [Paenibacillus sp. LjRoot153]|uniref:hypothetical protein n=1 Tax=Paenibacillus sp. LjRoot153 TaxID=3342270 RepID=UPI003ECC5E9F